MKTVLLTALALVAFATNSVLCRLALGGNSIDAAGFTMVRLLSGAVVLYVLLQLQRKRSDEAELTLRKGSWLASLVLFVYAVAFSYAYVSLDTGTGALILFASIQITMVIIGFWKGDRPSVLKWVGLCLAFAGFGYLMLPDASSPPWVGFGLMVIAGVAWSVYTYQGYAAVFPLVDTTYNFIRTLPLILVLFLMTLGTASYSLEGIGFALLSGAVASGMGYTVWYMALDGLEPTKAAVLQLLVPIIAAAGGVVFVAEPLTPQLIISTMIILTGILLVLKPQVKQT